MALYYILQCLLIFQRVKYIVHSNYNINNLKSSCRSCSNLGCLWENWSKCKVQARTKRISRGDLETTLFKTNGLQIKVPKKRVVCYNEIKVVIDWIEYNYVPHNSWSC